MEACITVDGEERVLKEMYHQMCVQFPSLDNWRVKYSDPEETGTFLQWIEKQEKDTYDPDGEGITLAQAFGEGILDEGDQTRLQVYAEIRDYIKQH